MDSASYGLSSLLIDMLFTAFCYLGIPLIITAIIYKKTKLVRSDIVIIVNALVVFVIFSAIAFLQGRSSSNVLAPFIWSSIAFCIARKKYGRNAKKCTHCHKLSNTDPCEHCGVPYKPQVATSEQRVSNVVLFLDRNGVDFDWISFEVYLDNAPYFVSSETATRLVIPAGKHEVYYKFRGSKRPVLNFEVIDLNEIITITCSLIDKNHISASVTDRSPRDV